MSAPKIQIKMPAKKEYCNVKPMAFITILQHIHRFWKKNDPKSEFAYGILIGKYEGTTRVITEAIPVLHSSKADVVFEESFYKHWDDYNKLKQELDSREECIGWYKTVDREIKFRAQDIRNQVKIQTLNPKNIAMLIDPQSFLEDKGYGFSIFHLIQSAGIFHEMCDSDKMPWEVLELGPDVDKVVNMVIEMIQKFPTDTPFVEELDEVKVPEIPKDDGDDDGEYITPRIDPNAPVFF